MKYKGRKIFAALVASTMICSAPVYAANNTQMYSMMISVVQHLIQISG